MGLVWQAADEVLSRPVAVKLLRSEYVQDPTFRERFRREARRTAALPHPGIASVFDYGEIEEPAPAAYLVMELIEGVPLSVLLLREGRLDVERTLDIIAQAALALGSAHQAGLVHRDVKPGNLLIRPDGVVKVTDFGIARNTSEAPQTETGLVLGTVAYLSPEQVAGRPATPASDVYALGIVAYECLAGRRPFTGEHPVALALAHHRHRPPPLPPDVPAPVRALVEMAMVKDPAARPADASEFARHALAAQAAVFGTSAAHGAMAAHAAPGIVPAANGTAADGTPAPAANGTAVHGAMAAHAATGVPAANGIAAGDHVLPVTVGWSSADGHPSAWPGQPTAEALIAAAGGLLTADDVPSAASANGHRRQRPGKPRRSGHSASGASSGHIDQETSQWKPVSLLLTMAWYWARQKRPVALAGIVSVLALLSVSLTGAAGHLAPTVAVPSVTGQQITKAGQALARAGLEVRQRASADRSTTAGVVLAQDPVGGTRVERGSVVTLTVSSGAPPRIGGEPREGDGGTAAGAQPPGEAVSGSAEGSGAGAPAREHAKKVSKSKDVGNGKQGRRSRQG